MKKIKQLGYSLVGMSTALMSSTALAKTTLPAVKSAGTPDDASTNLVAIAGKVFTTANMEMIGALLATVGIVIIIWKVAQLIFSSATWSEEVKMIMGGLVVMIIGTNFVSIAKVVVPSMASAWGK